MTLNAKITKAEHQALKIVAVKQSTTISDLLTDAIRTIIRKAERQGKPQAEAVAE